MLFQETNVSTPHEIVAAIGTFATALGWTVASGAPAPYHAGVTLTQPVTTVNPAPVPLSVVVDDVGGNEGPIEIFANWNAFAGTSDAHAIQFAPRDPLNTVFLAPVKVTIFGGTSPGPWLHCVVHYEFNRYRHIYIGSIKFLGALTGGECFNCSNTAPGSPNWDMNWNYLSSGQGYMGLPFAAITGYRGVNTPGNGGGARIIHANNPKTWREFSDPGFGAPPRMTNNVVYAGCGDIVNDGFFWRANASFAGAQVLVPFNVYASADTGHMIPVGTINGPRYVDMTNLQPEQTIAVAGANWRAFPQVRKTPDTCPSLTVHTGVWTESSGPFGIAFTENGA